MHPRLRPFLQVRSFSEQRSMLIPEPRPEAYYEWGARSQFDIDPFPDHADDHNDPSPTGRQHVDYWMTTFGTSIHETQLGVRSEHFVDEGINYNVDESVKDLLYTSLSFNSSKGRGVVFHLRTGGAHNPKFRFVLNDTPEEAQEGGFYPKDISDFGDI